MEYEKSELRKNVCNIFSFQIAKAVLDKFQTQILPGLVANMISGRNPFKMPQQMRKAQAAPSAVLQQAMAQREMLGKGAPGIRNEQQMMMMNRVDQRMQQREEEEEEEEEGDDDDVEEDTVPRRRSSNGEPQSEAEHQRRDLARRLRNSPRLKGLLQVGNENI